MAVMAVIRSLGLLFCMLLGFRKGLESRGYDLGLGFRGCVLGLGFRL